MELLTIRKIGDDIFECKYKVTGQLAGFYAQKENLLNDIQTGQDFIAAKNNAIAEVDVQIALWNSATDIEMPV
jgi:hypothetical protein